MCLLSVVGERPGSPDSADPNHNDEDGPPAENGEVRAYNSLLLTIFLS